MNEFYKENYLEKCRNLGTIYPYFNKELPGEIFTDFNQAFLERKNQGLDLNIDKVGLVEKVCLPYLLGNRTIFEGISRAPWMTSFRNGVFSPVALPEHGLLVPEKDDFTLKLKGVLVNEAKRYIENKKTVGILLSGGMDSRIVAGIVREIQMESPSLMVVGITWGDDSSRDVIYSKRICESFGWSFCHFPITSETLFNNISLSAGMGAEVSALHYHAMDEVSKLKSVDLILAGSYGDSVGRAEFSGKHVTRLGSILPNKLNSFGLVKSSLFDSVCDEIIKDASIPTDLNVPKDSLRQFEIEQECHYMRRMLQTCMHVIGSEIPLHQMFTDPEVFGLMWSLNPIYRNDDWYTFLLKILPGNLLEIPWARTGLTYQSINGSPDAYSKRYHQYGLWLRTDLKDEMLKVLESSSIRDIGVFNTRSLDALKFNWLRSRGVANNKLDEMVIWLASLDCLLNKNKIPKVNYSGSSMIKDRLNYIKGFGYGATYISARNLLNK